MELRLHRRPARAGQHLYRRDQAPEVEREILDEVGSYGRQLGHIGDALEVLVGRFDQSALGQPEKDALAILKGELAEIRKVKRRALGRAG